MNKSLQETIDQDRNIGSYGLKVEETDNLVKVTGIVDTLDEVKYAQKLANDMTKNKKVEMAVSISTDGPITDDDTMMEVAEEIADNPELRDKIDIRITKGRAYLSGQVDKRELKEEAEKAAAKARGVIDVINKIIINPTGRNDNVDDIFHTQVRNDQED